MGGVYREPNRERGERSQVTVGLMWLVVGVAAPSAAGKWSLLGNESSTSCSRLYQRRSPLSTGLQGSLGWPLVARGASPSGCVTCSPLRPRPFPPPYAPQKNIRIRDSKFGPALVVETSAISGGYMLGELALPHPPAVPAS